MVCAYATTTSVLWLAKMRRSWMNSRAARSRSFDVARSAHGTSLMHRRRDFADGTPLKRLSENTCVGASVPELRSLSGLQWILVLLENLETFERMGLILFS